MQPLLGFNATALQSYGTSPAPKMLKDLKTKVFLLLAQIRNMQYWQLWLSKKQYVFKHCQPFNDRARQHIGAPFFGHKSPAARARKSFIPNDENKIWIVAGTNSHCLCIFSNKRIYQSALNAHQFYE